MDLLTAKDNLNKITFDDTAIDELYFYNSEFQRHHIGSLFGQPQDKHNAVYMLLLQSFDISDKIKKEKSGITLEQFEVIKQKIYFLIEDLIAFLKDNNLEDKTMVDVFKY